MRVCSVFRRKALAVMFLVSALLVVRCPVDGVPLGFVDEFVSELPGDQLVHTGAFATANNGDTLLFLASKLGFVYVVVNPHTDPDYKLILLMKLPVCSNGARGIQSLMPHPDFDTNGYLYIFKTDIVDSCELDAADTEMPKSRLSRFTVSSTSGIPEVDITTEQSLFVGPPLDGATHNGGGMAFGNDGCIWITLGDGGNRTKYSQDLQTLHSAVLRITDQGDIPDDNPNVGVNGVRCNETGVVPQGSSERAVCSEIWANGLRSPYTIAMDINAKDKVRFFIGDVGGTKWEELSESGTDYARKNYGWDTKEGPCKAGSAGLCPILTKYTDPAHWWEHRRGEGCVIAGQFVPNGLWPEEYDNTLIFADHTFGEIYVLVDEGPGYGCRSCLPPTSNYRNITFHEAKSVVNLFWGPYKNTTALYYLVLGRTPALRRIRYTGSSNRPPQAVVTASTTLAEPGTIIFLNAEQSRDPDDDNITYSWDFGDNTTSSEVLVKKSFDERGRYTVDVVVEDSQGLTDRTRVTVQIGRPPDVIILTPTEGTTFAVGDKFTLNGMAFSFEGNDIATALNKIVWEVRLHHADHWHVFLPPTIGNNILLDAAPSPEDFEAATNSFLRVIATVTDDLGLTTTVIRDVMPSLAYVDLRTDPSGLLVSVDNTPFQTPGRVVSWENHDLTLSPLDSSIHAEDQEPYLFLGWSTGETSSTIVLHDLAGGNASVPEYIMHCRRSSYAPPLPSSSTEPSDIPSSVPSLPPTSGPSHLTTSPSSNPTDSYCGRCTGLFKIMPKGRGKKKKKLKLCKKRCRSLTDRKKDPIYRKCGRICTLVVKQGKSFLEACTEGKLCR